MDKELLDKSISEARNSGENTDWLDYLLLYVDWEKVYAEENIEGIKKEID